MVWVVKRKRTGGRPPVYITLLTYVVRGRFKFYKQKQSKPYVAVWLWLFCDNTTKQ